MLEFDPERVPAVILRQRNVSQASLIYWWKDAEISSEVKPNSILLSARPPSAQVQFAIYDTCDQVDRELRLCRQLDNETHFVQIPGGAEEAYRWTAASAVSRDVLPRNNAYVYINGAFRPDTNKLLHLLSGIELYGDPLASIRELLQNAFDAVREQIAYERLSKDDPANPDYEDQLALLHRVDLRVNTDEAGATLTCTDAGIGMNLKIIENHFLVSGSPRRHDIAELEKRCNQHGFSTERTGRFGIGVLSYFMIGESVRIETVRGTFPKDSDGTGWTFETTGIGGFGQLTRNSSIAQGSRVTIRLRREIHANLEKWCEKLRDYLHRELLRLPCRLNYSSPFTEKILWGPGWCGVTLPAPSSSNSRLPEILPRETADQLNRAGSNMERLMREAMGGLSWQETFGSLRDEAGRQLGRYRIAVPTFLTPVGRSVPYFDAKLSGREIIIDRVGPLKKDDRPLDGFSPQFKIRLAWKGMSTTPKTGFEDFPAAVDVDLTSDGAGVLSVSRNQFRLTNSALNSIKAIIQQISRLTAADAAACTGPFALINSVYSGVLSKIETPIYWPITRRSSTTMEPVRFPAISLAAFDSPALPGLKWKNKTVSTYLTVDLYGRSIEFSQSALAPSKVVVFRGSPQPVYTRDSVGEGLPLCQFPPTWDHVIGADEVLNEAHSIIRNMTVSGREWIDNTLNGLNPLPFFNEIRTSADRAASWIFLMVSQYRDYDDWTRILWLGLCQQHGPAIGELWRVAFGTNAPDRAMWLTDVYGDWNALVLSPAGWDIGQWTDYLEDPGPDWTITVAPAKPRKKRSTSPVTAW